jgi:phosphatidate phosphatase APP1
MRRQQTEIETETRDIGKFHDFEVNMPHLSRGYSGAYRDRLSSYLGEYNPFYKVVDPDEHSVWLFDNIAYRNAENAWEVVCDVAYFVKNSGKDISKTAADVAEKLGLAKDSKAEKTIAKRLQPFIDQILPAHVVNMDVGNQEVHRLGPSSRDGISTNAIRLRGEYNDGDKVQCDAVGVSSEMMTTHFAGPTGWAVISDIDDTIKKTLTASPIGILQTTFVDDPEPIAGMPDLYKHIRERLNHPPFWYLSASPYNLYPFLKAFRNQYYPSGQMLLRESSWMTLAGLFANLTQGTQAYKVDHMQKIHSTFPSRKFVCIGDSTQMDPESYAEMYRSYPDWIGAIFIRKVTGVAEMDASKKNSDERFAAAFKDIPSDIYYVFTDPEELYDKIDALAQSN